MKTPAQPKHSPFEHSEQAGGVPRSFSERRSPLHLPSIHESGYEHASGKAIYIDDLPEPRDLLVGMCVPSTIAKGRLVGMNVEAAQAVPGVAAVLTASDIPGINDVSPFSHDEPLLSEGEIQCVGQHIALIVADSYRTCREAAKALNPEYEEETPILTIQEAMENDSFLTEPHIMKRGNTKESLEQSYLVLEGEVEVGGQDHFYLETQVAMSLPLEGGNFHVYSSTQHPSEVQAKVAEALGISRHKVVVEVRRLGGGFGGKETQGNMFAALAALGTHVTGRPVKIWLNRDQDMTQTGKRHPLFARYRAGLTEEGMLTAVEAWLVSDGGWSADLSAPVLDRALFHLDNAYYIPALYFEGRVAKTNLVSNTAFRGFGGPQGMMVMEEILNIGAETLGMDPAELRRRNFYGDAPRNHTPYYQMVKADRSERIYHELMASSMYEQRRAILEEDNKHSRWVKRGIGFQPIKFGISFTNSVLNQAGAFINIYADGSVQLSHGGTEMGQGLHTKMLAVCAHELGIPVSQIRLMDTSTDKVPNTSATAASSGSDLNGAAIKNACESLMARLRPVAADLLGLSLEEKHFVVFEEGQVFDGRSPSQKLEFSQVTQTAYERQVSLSSTGFYRTPDIFYDHSRGQGKPFHYYAYGAAVTEIEVNGLTGEHRILRIDVLHDVGHSLVPTVDRGQIEGGFVQGMGWLTREELVWSKDGHLRTHSPDTYKIPSLGEAPLEFHIGLLSRAEQEGVIHGSKAVGEPPFMLALSVITALRHAIQAFRPEEEIHLTIPATPEAVLRAIHNKE